MKLVKYLSFCGIFLFFVICLSAGCSKKMVKESGSGTESDASEEVSEEVDIDELKGYAGDYNLTIAGSFKGKLKLWIEDGRFAGFISFDNWGRGLKEPLKNLKINKGKIYFLRSITTPEGLAKYGSTRYFKQQFFGKFYQDGKIIKGYLSDSGSETAWRAEK